MGLPLLLSSSRSPPTSLHCASSQQPAPSTQQPAASSQQPAPSTQHPAASSQQPAASSQHPAASSQQPAPSTPSSRPISSCDTFAPRWPGAFQTDRQSPCPMHPAGGARRRRRAARSLLPLNARVAHQPKHGSRGGVGRPDWLGPRRCACAPVRPCAPGSPLRPPPARGRSRLLARLLCASWPHSLELPLLAAAVGAAAGSGAAAKNGGSRPGRSLAWLRRADMSRRQREDDPPTLHPSARHARMARAISR
jgi:hypothetical protein